MTFKQFAKKVSPKLIKETESIGLLGFEFEGRRYSILSQQWGQGKNRENLCLWGEEIGKKSTQIFPFQAEEVDKMKFFRLQRR